MRQTNVRGNLSLRGFRKLRTGAIVATGVILLGLGFLAPTVSASEQDGVWVARTVAEVKADLQKEGDLFKYVIKWGDTLSVISEVSNIPVDVLQEMNQASGKNLSLPHNELYFTEAETVSDTVTKHKIVIKESGASGEVRTYEVLLKKDKETKAVTFELTDVTEKVEKMAVNYSPVYQPVSAPVVERAEESGEKPASEASAETSPEVKEETATPVAPKAEDAATTPAPKETAPEVVTPADPKVEAPTETAPVVEEGTSGEQDQPAEETPAPSKPETPSSTEEIAKEVERTEPEVAKPTEPKEAESTTEGASTGTVESAPASTESAANGAEGTEGVTPKVEKTAPAGEEGKSEPTESAPRVEAPAETAEPTETEPEVAKPATPKEEGTTAEAGTEVNPTAKEDAPEGTVSEGTTEKEKSEQASNEAGTTPGAEAKETEETVENTEETKQDEELKAFILEEIDNIITGEDGIATSKLKEIDKIQDEEKKAELKDKLKKLTEEAEIEIKKAKDSEAAISITEKYRDMIDAIEVPGEKYTKPNYDKDNLSNGRNDGTTIEGGSTAIGHGSGEAPSATTQPAPAEGTDNSSATTSPTQPATGTTSDSTVTDQPQPASTEEQPVGTTEPKAGESATSGTQSAGEAPATTTTSPASSAQPTNESSASTGEATQPEATTESPVPTQPAAEPTSDSAPTAKPQPVATSETETSGTSSFRRAGEYRATARRVARSVNEPEGTINISYNYDGMPDIHGFFADPGENNTVTVTNSTTEDKVKELVKAKIQAKANELAKHGYKVKEEIVFEQDTTVKNFNYVVTFTKEKAGTTGFRIAPKVQVRAKKVVKRDLSNKTKHINVYYNLTSLKDIAGALGEVGENNLLTLPGNATKEDIKKAVAEKTKSQIEKLNKQGFTVKSTTDLDQIIEGGDSYDYVVEFTKESKTQPVGTTGFRKAPLVQRRAKRSTEVKETVNVNIYFNLKTLPGIAGALDVDGETTIKLPKNASEEEVKEAIKAKIAKVENRGYKVIDAYFGAKTEKGYDYVVEFTK